MREFVYFMLSKMIPSTNKKIKGGQTWLCNGALLTSTSKLQ